MGLRGLGAALNGSLAMVSVPLSLPCENILALRKKALDRAMARIDSTV